MRSHGIRIHSRKLERRQHRHYVDVAPALAFNHALLADQGPVVGLRRRVAAAGRDDQRKAFTTLPWRIRFILARRASPDLLL